VRYNRPYTIALPNPVPRTAPLPAFPDAGAALDALLAHRDVCSRRSIFQRYDGVVRATTAIPLGAADAGVICPIPGAPLAVALAVAGNPRYGKIDPQLAAEHAVLEAVRDVVAVGARPLGLTDCLNFGDPTVPEHLGAMIAAIDGLSYAARRLGTPFVSGNVSLYNQSTSGRSVAPSPIVACVGTIADISKTATSALKRPGSTLRWLGAAPAATFGGSVYAELMGFSSTRLPVPNYGALRRSIAALLAAYDRNAVFAAHDVSDGGLLAALAEMAFPTLDGTPVGVALDRADLGPFDGIDLDAFYFSETGGFIVEVADDRVFEEVLAEHGAFAPAIGTTTDRAELVLDLGFTNETIELFRLREAWSAPLRDFYGAA
jgi:phosphoribosylformylglycinamidine synthase